MKPDTLRSPGSQYMQKDGQGRGRWGDGAGDSRRSHLFLCNMDRDGSADLFRVSSTFKGEAETPCLEGQGQGPRVVREAPHHVLRAWRRMGVLGPWEIRKEQTRCPKPATHGKGGQAKSGHIGQRLPGFTRHDGAQVTYPPWNVLEVRVLGVSPNTWLLAREGHAHTQHSRDVPSPSPEASRHRAGPCAQPPGLAQVPGAADLSSFTRDR